jgi:hypothetical protein
MDTADRPIDGAFNDLLAAVYPWLEEPPLNRLGTHLAEKAKGKPITDPIETSSSLRSRLRLFPLRHRRN